MSTAMAFGQSNLCSGFRDSGQFCFNLCQVGVLSRGKCVNFDGYFSLFIFPFSGLIDGFIGVHDPLYEELWKACAGPLVEIPRQGEGVYYFPQGHMEQVSQFLPCFHF